MDRRRDVVLNRIPSIEDQEVLDGPFESANVAMRHSLASGESMAFANIELVERQGLK